MNTRSGFKVHWLPNDAAKDAFDDDKDEAPMKKPQKSTYFIFNTGFPKQSPILIIIAYL
jgi:hypothetical protein